MVEANATVNLEIEHINASWQILPAQFYARPTRSDPRLALLTAILEDAYATLSYVAHTPAPYKFRRLAYDDSQWFLSDSDRPFGFRWTAEHLGLDVDRIRAALQPYFVAKPDAPAKRRHALLDKPAVAPGKRYARKRYAGYRQFTVTVLARYQTAIVVRVGPQRARFDLSALHPDTAVSHAGDRGILLCTTKAARKAGLPRRPAAITSKDAY